MSDDKQQRENTQSEDTRKLEDLPPAAQRALKEARERREKIDAAAAKLHKEVDCLGGKDPARFGDWEVKGIAVDF
ncbi:MAG: DUF1674 domain-containing protein [Pseudomonadota bacterium]